jgi:hypothetical protein
MKKYAFFTLLVLFFVDSVVFGQKKETRSVSTFTEISYRVPGKLYLRQGSPQKVELEGDADVLEEIETKVTGGRLVIGKEGKWFDWNWSNDRITVYITVEKIEGISVAGSGDLVAETKLTADGDLDLNVSGSGSLKADVEARGKLDADISGSGRLDVKGRCRNFESSISGSGRVVLNANVAEDSKVSVSGSGKIEASGSTKTIQTSISGSGKILASNLQAEKCNVRISGSGDLEISVKNELNVNISGSGSVSYKGNPSRVDSHSSGSGRVRKIG